MIRISKIANHEIHTFADESKFTDWENIPISKYRAVSYSKNPRSNPQDIVLYLAFLNDKLVGYRTIMPDSTFIGSTQIKVGWLSGNWVHNDFRRKGIATLLFNEAYQDWGNRLLYTNYALESKAVYDKSEKFELLASIIGRRFYLKSCLSIVLPARSVIFKKLYLGLEGLDYLLNLINPIPWLARNRKLGEGVELEYLSNPDAKTFELFEKECASTINHRTRTDLEWIFDYPWLVSSPTGDLMGEKYFFSSNPRNFSQTIIKVYKDKSLLGFLMLNLNDGKLSIPYCSFNSSDSVLMANLLFNHAIKHGASIITVYDPNLINAMNQKNLLRFFSKKRIQNYFGTKELVKELKDNTPTFKAGDGDCAFI